jgi:hypothetical protein
MGWEARCGLSEIISDVLAAHRTEDSVDTALAEAL